MLALHHLPVLFAEEAAGGGIAVLGLNFGALILQLATFVIVFLILRKYAFGPIVNVLEQRRERIEEGLANAEAMDKAKIELDEHKEQVLAEARKSAAKIVADSKHEAAEVLAAAEAKARKKSDQMVAEAEARIADQVQAAEKNLQQTLSGLVRQATEKVLRTKLDDAADTKLVEQATKELNV